MPLVSLGLSSVQVIQFRSLLCEALHIPVESLPLAMLMQGVGDGNSIEEIVAALQSAATDQRRSEPETPVPELPPKESHETSLVWACTLCACILQPMHLLGACALVLDTCRNCVCNRLCHLWSNSSA